MMDRLGQITAICADRNFNCALSEPYRHVRAIWALWRICRDLRFTNPKAVILRAAPPFVITLILYFIVLYDISSFFVINLIGVIFAVIIFSGLFYLTYWIFAPEEIFEFQNEIIKQRDLTIKGTKRGSAYNSESVTTDTAEFPPDQETLVLRNLRSSF